MIIILMLLWFQGQIDDVHYYKNMQECEIQAKIYEKRVPYYKKYECVEAKIDGRLL